MVLMKRGGHGGRGARVFYFGKKGGWKVIVKEPDVNIQERCNNVHFDDRLKSSGRGDDLLAFCVESIFDARVFHSGEKQGANRENLVSGLPDLAIDPNPIFSES